MNKTGQVSALSRLFRSSETLEEAAVTALAHQDFVYHLDGSGYRITSHPLGMILETVQKEGPSLARILFPSEAIIGQSPSLARQR